MSARRPEHQAPPEIVSKFFASVFVAVFCQRDLEDLLYRKRLLYKEICEEKLAKFERTDTYIRISR